MIHILLFVMILIMGVFFFWVISTINKLFEPCRFVKARRMKRHYRELVLRELRDHCLFYMADKLFVHVCNGEIEKPRDDGKAHLFLFASPDVSETRLFPDKVFGLQIDGVKDSLTASGQGYTIKDQLNWEVAELYDGRNLYILFDVQQFSIEEVEMLLKEIFRMAFARRNLSSQEFEERYDNPKLSLIDERRRFTAALIDPELSKDVQVARKNALEAATMKRQAVRKLQSLQATIRSNTTDSEVQSQVYEKLSMKALAEKEALSQVQKVQSICFEDGVIIARTEELYCKDPRSEKEHFIGEFEIQIFPDGSRGGVRWYNQSRQVDAYRNGMQAPNVLADGSALVGRHTAMFPKLIGDLQFKKVLQLAVRFIEQVNVRERAGSFIDRWPVQDEAA